MHRIDGADTIPLQADTDKIGAVPTSSRGGGLFDGTVKEDHGLRV